MEVVDDASLQIGQNTQICTRKPVVQGVMRNSSHTGLSSEFRLSQYQMQTSAAFALLEESYLEKRQAVFAVFLSEPDAASAVSICLDASHIVAPGRTGHVAAERTGNLGEK